jgi:hypothetical protein
MDYQLLTSSIWKRLTAAVKKRPGGCSVAVAYFGTGASKLLPLKEGSVLVVNMSRQAVGSGQTNPSEVLKLVNKGVSVHSVKNLHAKVFVVGQKAFIGSTNASNHSANGLLEAALETTNRTVAAACRKFVRSLRGEFVTPEHAKRMKKFYRPPQFGTPTRTGHAAKDSQPEHEPLWVVPLVRESWKPEDEKQADEGRPKAHKKLRSSRWFKIDEFHWNSGAFLRSIDEEHLLMQILDESNKSTMVHPSARVVHIQRYRRNGGNHAIVFLEVPKKLRPINLKRVVKRMGPAARTLGKLKSPKTLREWGFVHALLNLWPSTNGR